MPKASISEPASEAITTAGMTEMNAPMVPVMPKIGIKAAMVVAVDAMTGQKTSFAPWLAA